MKIREYADNEIYQFSTTISSPNEIIRISRVLEKCIGQKIQVMVIIPNGGPDELVVGEVQEIFEQSGALALIMANVVCKESKAVERDAYKIDLKVISKIEILPK